MKLILRLWIFGSTAWLLLAPARLEHVWKGVWRNISALDYPVWMSGIHYRETHIDITTTLAIIIAVNFIPCVVLLNYGSISGWIYQRRKLIAAAAAAVLVTVIVSGFAMAFQQQPAAARDPIYSERDQFGGIAVYTPTPSPTPIILVPATPVPVRGAIPAVGMQVRRAEPVNR